MPKEEHQVLKVKLPDNTHLNIPIFSRGNIKEYLMHIVAVFRIIKQKGLDLMCRKLGKALVKQSETLKNLLKTSGSKRLSRWMLMFKPTRWRLSRPNRCSKNSRRCMTMQLPRRTSN
jgi:hypothetical protein